MVTSRKLPPAPPHLEIVAGPPETPTAFSAADYLQLGHAGRRTFRVEVGRGYIDLVEGTLHAAVDDEGSGGAALLRLLVDGGLTGTQPARCFEGPPAGEKNLDIEVENALLEAARRVDETGHGGEPTGTLTSDIEQAFDGFVPARGHDEDRPAPLDTDVDPVEAGLSAVLRKDYRAAHAAFSRAADLGDDSPMVRANIDRLASILRG